MSMKRIESECNFDSPAGVIFKLHNKIYCIVVVLGLQEFVNMIIIIVNTKTL